MSTNPSKALARAAQRAIEKDFFLASVLHEYQQINHLNDDALALFLGCDSKDLPRLALCRCPADQQDAFLNDLELLAKRFHLQVDRLASVIRQVGTLRMLREKPVSMFGKGTQGLLQAARDRDDPCAGSMEETP